MGVAAVRGPSDAATAEDAHRFAAWVDAGRAGEMEYLKRRDEAGTLVRSALQVAMPWARSVVVCALNYNARRAEVHRSSIGGRGLDRPICMERQDAGRWHDRSQRITTMSC